MLQRIFGDLLPSRHVLLQPVQRHRLLYQRAELLPDPERWGGLLLEWL